MTIELNAAKWCGLQLEKEMVELRAAFEEEDFQRVRKCLDEIIGHAVDMGQALEHMRR
jgi:hypothetical protein